MGPRHEREEHDDDGHDEEGGERGTKRHQEPAPRPPLERTVILVRRPRVQGPGRAQPDCLIRVYFYTIAAVAATLLVARPLTPGPVSNFVKRKGH